MAMNLLTALFSTVGYCLLMNVPRNKIVPASINGMLSWGLYLLLKDHIESVFYLLVVVASFTAAYSEVAAKIAKTPATVFLLPGLIPLIPGGFVYYAMLGLVLEPVDHDAAERTARGAVGGRHCCRHLRRGGHPADHPPYNEPLTLLLLYHRKPRP